MPTLESTPAPQRYLPFLGRTVPALGVGCWGIGGPTINRGIPVGWDDVTDDDALAGLRGAWNLGSRLFDTADVYGLGRSERILGRLLGEVNRAEAIVSSKVGYFAGTAEHPYLPSQIRHQFATTLTNLGTDYLDIYHLHSDDFGPNDRYLPEAVAYLRQLREEGKIRAIGIRAPHEFAEQWATRPGIPPQKGRATRRFLALTRRVHPDVISVRYNLLTPPVGPDETDIFAFARRQGIGVIIKQALGQGLLVATENDHRTFGAGDHRTRDPHFRPAIRAAIHQHLDPIRARFGGTPADLARVALRYALHRDPQTPALAGFRTAQQINTTLTCLGAPLTDDELDFLRQHARRIPALLVDPTHSDIPEVPPAPPLGS